MRLVDDVMLDLRQTPALQQPEWSDPEQLRRVCDLLAQRPPLVRPADVAVLRAQLAGVAGGRALIVQAGDCAEDPQECTRAHVGRKAAALDAMATALVVSDDRPVVRVGRIGGQFAKPRSQPTEQVGGRSLPVFRGHLVNGPEPTPEDRRADPLRLVTGYMAAADIMTHLGWYGSATRAGTQPPIWTSHEALLLDYELSLLRTGPDGTRYLGSTHWPWIGERTRQLDGAHVALLSRVANPVACKVGPSTTRDELLALCDRLDPERQPGRLTLISRMGAGVLAGRLPALVEAVRAEGHPVIWLCDPMHGNTVTAADGRKSRVLQVLAAEVREFAAAVAAAGGVAGGLHLETTPDDVTECVDDEAELHLPATCYTTLCDPRLTVRQALALISAWPARTAVTPA